MPLDHGPYYYDEEGRTNWYENISIRNLWPLRFSPLMTFGIVALKSLSLCRSEVLGDCLRVNRSART